MIGSRNSREGLHAIQRFCSTMGGIMATGNRIRLAGGFLSVLIFCFAISAATSYMNFQYTRNIMLNTKASGANLASGSNVSNFPVLVRLSGKGSNGGTRKTLPCLRRHNLPV